MQKITEENCIRAKVYNFQEVSWLKSKGKELGRWALLGIWFNTAEAVDETIHYRLLVGQRYIGSVELCQVRNVDNPAIPNPFPVRTWNHHFPFSSTSKNQASILLNTAFLDQKLVEDQPFRRVGPAEGMLPLP